MPTSLDPMIDLARRLAITTIAYAIAVAVAASILLPTIFTPIPVTALLPKPPPVVARTPPAAPAPEAAP